MTNIEIIPKTLSFKKPAMTSRGVYTERKVFYVKISSGDRTGIGECAPLPLLSQDDIPDYEEKLKFFCDSLMKKNLKIEALDEELQQYPSIRFGLEIALRFFENSVPWKNDFSEGRRGIPINGLVWMGSFKEMSEEIEKKIGDGFKCIKIKIGSIDFDEELKLLEQVRKNHGADEIELRVDANGAFSAKEALEKLQKLSEYEIHSVEQPIKQGQPEEMALLCRISPVPVALDEELIKCTNIREKTELLDKINPAYLVLKPSLHGGIKGCEEWIRLAENKGIRYWVTSALESNIGLNAISMWCGSLNTYTFQGLGTGVLFYDNCGIPPEIKNGELWMKTL